MVVHIKKYTACAATIETAITLFWGADCKSVLIFFVACNVLKL